MITGLKQLFSESASEIKRLYRLVNQVNQLEKKYESFSDEQLRNMTLTFRERLQNGEKLDNLKIEAFAVVREAAKRVLGLRHYDVQLIGGFVLANGSIAQMYTGEGKTLVATLPSYLYALEGQGVHIVTANEYLARRDKEQMGKVHEFLGLNVGLNVSQLSPRAKQEAYQADITYGTGTEFGFDYLRDHMVNAKEDKVQRKLHYCIVDEVDSILIDEARTPLIIASKTSEGAELYKIIAMVVREFKEDADYEFFQDSREAHLTDLGASKIEEAFDIDNLYAAEHQELLQAVTQALKAHATLKLDVDYIIKDGKIALIDQFTGRVMEGRSFSDGLHQAIEAKEGVEITPENETFATITIQNYFGMYEKLAGMTGSAMPSKREFYDTYNLKVVEIPTNKPVLREDFPDLVYADYKSKVKKIVAEVKKIHSTGRPILIGTTSIEQSEKLSKHLTMEKIDHQVLNAKTEEAEARIIANAGQKNQVMIATNMAGRGTDILLGEGVKELGGLHIIGTEKHESARIDMQLRGRAGRQGDPGSSQFIVSLEDDLFRHYDKEDMEHYLKKMKKDENGLVLSPDPVSFVNKVQETIANQHYSARIHLLKLESVMDRQCKVIYAMRDRILEIAPEELIDEALDYLQKYLHQLQEQCFSQGTSSPQKLAEELAPIFPDLNWSQSDLEELEQEDVEKALQTEYSKLEAAISPLKADEQLAAQVKAILLNQMDRNWVKHLVYMAQIKDGITLTGYAHEDPYQKFEIVGYDEFKYLLFMIQKEVSIRLLKLIKSDIEEDFVEFTGEGVG